jgi:hypothetical protein
LLSLNNQADMDCLPPLASKHERQYTGRSLFGTNGTSVSAPHSAHVTFVKAARLACFLAERHFGHLLGSPNPFSPKNCCSSAVNSNVSPQSAHVNVLLSMLLILLKK